MVLQVSLEEPWSRASAVRHPAPALQWASHRTCPGHIGDQAFLIPRAHLLGSGRTSTQTCFVLCCVWFFFSVIIVCRWKDMFSALPCHTPAALLSWSSSLHAPITCLLPRSPAVLWRGVGCVQQWDPPVGWNSRPLGGNGTVVRLISLALPRPPAPGCVCQGIGALKGRQDPVVLLESASLSGFLF